LSDIRHTIDDQLPKLTLPARTDGSMSPSAAGVIRFNCTMITTSAVITMAFSIQ
jgi:hypothetical protein